MPVLETTTTRPQRLGWLGVIAVTLGIFSIVTTEILPIGLLTPMADDFGVSEGRAGWLMTMPGLVAAVAAPVITVTTARLDRRVMLCALMVLLAAANFLAAAASEYWLELVARLMVGMTIGGFWSIGAGLAARLVPEQWVVRATAVIFSAVPLGSVLGVPAGTFIGDRFGWRVPFVVLGVLTVCVLAALLAVLPPLPATAGDTARSTARPPSSAADTIRPSGDLLDRCCALRHLYLRDAFPARRSPARSGSASYCSSTAQQG